MRVCVVHLPESVLIINLLQNLVDFPTELCFPSLIMSLQLSFCEDRDMVDVFAVISASFGHEHPYIESLFPDHDQPLGRQRGGERLLNIKHTDPNTTFLKVVDINSKQIVGVAKWIVYNGVLPEESVPDGPFWANQDEKELAQDMFRGYNVPRMKAIRESGGNLVCESLRMILHFGC